MDRLLAFGGGLWLSGIFSMAYGLTQLSIPWITVGAILSSVFTPIQFVSTRIEARSKSKIEKADKLYLPVYNPMSGWTKTGIEELDAHQPEVEDVWFDFQRPFPDVEKEGLFAQTGDVMRSRIKRVRKVYDDFHELRLKVRGEYRQRLEGALKEFLHNWDVSQVRFQSARGNESFGELALDAVSRYRLGFIRERVSNPWKVTLVYPPLQGITDCPKELVDFLTNTKDLPSYPEFIAARSILRSELGSFNSELDYAIVHGERDW